MISRGLLRDTKKLREHFPGKRYAIITHDSLQEYATLLENTLEEVHVLTFPSGEKHKTRETKAALEDELCKRGLGRDTCIIGLGGGVITDLAGYLAATFCRGVPLVLIPTTLTGMVDAAIGGKNGVNTPYGKNLIGTVYHPKQILIDPTCLTTLPQRELKSGIVEMIKHGLIADRNYFDFLNTNAEEILSLHPATIDRAILDSYRIKTAIVKEDEMSHGKRNILNFGHTVGHAIEKVTDFTLPHGEAVAIGILIESHIAMQLGHLTAKELEKISQTLNRLTIPLHLPENNILEAMSLDKKSINSTPRFVIIDGIGNAEPCGGAFCCHVDTTIIKNAIEWFKDALCCH